MNEEHREVYFYPDLEIVEALSHRTRARIFEIMGYLDIINKKSLSSEDQEYFSRVEKLCKNLINEIHAIINHYRNS